MSGTMMRWIFGMLACVLSSMLRPHRNVSCEICEAHCALRRCDPAQLAEQLGDEIVHVGALRAPAPSIGQNLPQLRETPVEVVVDQHVVILAPVCDFLDGVA